MAAVGLGAIRLSPSLIDGENDDPGPVYSPVDFDLDDDLPEPDTSKGVEVEGGGVVIRIGPPKAKKKDVKFDDNLAEHLDDAVLANIGTTLIELIEDDNRSRQEWLDTRAEGMKILGFKIENMRSNGADGSAPLEGQNQMRATVLAEAVVRFGANAFAELCPSDGPAKVGEDTISATSDLDDLADALEKVLNRYLTVTDKPWVPDTDAMLVRVGVDGCVFKKVYHDPILRRPVSRAVYGEDLIVNNSAKSVYDAKRITHRVTMGASTVRRMQIIKAWRDVKLSDPDYIQKDAIQQEEERIGGVRRNEGFDREDQDREFYETYCELDIPGFEHETDGKSDGLAVPYKVTIDKASREVMEVRRNWAEDDEMCLPDTFFVQFAFIRGFGFYGVGLSHLLGNITNGLTAAYREFLDAGMMACFPALLMAKGGAKQDSSIIRVPAGGAREIETGGLAIQQTVMGMPYKPPDAVFVGFVQQLEQTAQRLGGTADVMVGEGRQDAPVGTTLALIEQAIKPLLATHKRLCAAQSDELQLLVERFREDPDALVASLKGSRYSSWDCELALQALNTYTVVARADPNTASHLQRMLRNAALYQMAKDDPNSFNMTKVRQVCIRGIGFADPNQYLNIGAPPPPPDPKAQAAMIGANADMLDAQTRAGQLQLDAKNAPMENQRSQTDAQAKIMSAKLGVQKQQLATKTAEIQSRNEAQKPMGEQLDRQFEGQQNQADRAVDLLKQQRDHAHALHLAGMERQGELQQAGMEHQGRIQEAGMQHQTDMARVGAEQQGKMQEAQFQHASGMQQGEQQHQTAMEQGKQQQQGKLREIAATPRPPAGGAQRRADGGPVGLGNVWPFPGPVGV